MKLYQYIKNENERKALLFGFPIMKQTSDYRTNERFQEFLFGLIKTQKMYNPIENTVRKEIQFLNKSIVKRVEENNFKTISIFGCEILKTSLLDEFKKRNFKYIDKKHDDIYILRANSGEVYLTLAYIIDVLIKKNGSKTPLLIATRKYHIDIIQMLCPEIPYIYLEKINLNVAGDYFKIDEFRFFVLFDSKHFKNVEDEIKSSELGKAHYFTSILNKFDIDKNELNQRKIHISKEIQDSALLKAKNIGLNLEKFIFIAPEALSCKLCDSKFWVELIKKVKELNYDVFVNLASDEVKLENVEYKTCELTFSEAFALAKKAKKIVSLRSGLTEFLLQTQVPIDVLYTKFRYRHIFDDMDSYHVMSGFGIKYIPFVDTTKIQEFNMLEISSEECVDRILSKNLQTNCSEMICKES